MPPVRFRHVLCVALALGAGIARADDWPRWRGPQLNGISLESDWSSRWPEQGPPLRWKQSVGQGFSSVAVADGRLFTLGSEGDTATVRCLDAATGKLLWKHSYPEPLNPRYYEGGTSSTPTVDGDLVYVLGRQGDLFCFEAATGKVTWHKNVAAETGAKVPEWGFASSPLVEGRTLLLNVGPAGLAVNKLNGKVTWSSGEGPAGYASVVPLHSFSQRPALVFTHRELVAVDMKTGKEAWRFPFPTEYDTNAADPILYGARIFLSSHNQPGLMLRLLDGKPEAVWRAADTRVHLNAGVVFQDYLYTFHGSAGKPGDLRCLDLRNGEVKWKHAGLGVGSLMAADNRLIILGERGELVVAEANPDSFLPLARAQVLGGKCWTVPVLANGRIYCRNARGELACLDVRR